MTESESSLQKWFKEELKKMGIFCFRHGIVTKLPGGGYARIPDDEVGVPDIIACIRGKFVGFEMKKEGEDLSPDQKKRKFDIEKNEGIYFKVDSRNEGYLILTAIKNWCCKNPPKYDLEIP